MDNNIDIKTFQICRTCMKEISGSSFYYLDSVQADTELTTTQKLSDCIPELDLNITPNAVICTSCADIVTSFYIFKKECLHSDMQIHEYIQQRQCSGDVIDLVEVAHYRNLTTELKTEVFEITDDFKTVLYDTEVFNEEGSCIALINTDDCFTDYGKSTADTYASSSTAQDHHTKNLNQTDNCYLCNRCGYQAESNLKLILHFKKCHMIARHSKNRETSFYYYKCYLCSNYVTKYKSILALHNRRHLTKKDYKQMLNGGRPNQRNSSTFNKANKSSKDHPKLGTHIGGKPFKCSICEYQCNYKGNLKKHMRIHAEEKPFKCLVCKFQSKWKNSLDRHMVTHSGQKRLNKANKSSKTKHVNQCKDLELCNTLKSNLRTHTQKKEFKCSVCEYQCDNKFKMNHHILVIHHEQGKVLECPRKCPTSKSKSKCSLKQNHEQRKVKKKVLKSPTSKFKSKSKCRLKQYKCSVCGYYAKSNIILEYHMFTYHAGKRPFQCSVCAKWFTWSDYLKTWFKTGKEEKLFVCSVCEYNSSK